MRNRARRLLRRLSTERRAATSRSRSTDRTTTTSSSNSGWYVVSSPVIESGVLTFVRFVLAGSASGTPKEHRGEDGHDLQGAPYIDLARPPQADHHAPLLYRCALSRVRSRRSPRSCTSFDLPPCTVAGPPRSRRNNRPPFEFRPADEQTLFP